MRKLVLVFVSTLALFCQVYASHEDLLQKLLSDSALKGSLVGVFVQTADEPPQTLCAINETNRFMPASNVKLFTSALALERLGEDFTFTTPLLTDGQIESETLNGNLYLKGVGDPSLTRDRLKAMAKILVSKGIKFVNGDVVVDVSAFVDNRWGLGWSWDYLHFGYASEVWAIALDRNSVTVQVAPSAIEGQPAQISSFPPTDWLIFENRIRTVKSGRSLWSVWREPWERVVRFWGQIPLSAQPETIRVSIPSVPHYVGETFRSILHELGIRVSGSVRVDLTPQRANVIAETNSQTLKELIWWLNKFSDNLYAEMLLRAVALKEKGRGSLNDAFAILEQQLRNWGIEPEDVRLFDGSGLSRLNIVTPRAIVQLLRIARTRPWFSAFKNSLPIAGVDGTLRTRFRGTSAEGKILAKTGYIGSVVSLSGYIQRAKDSELIFSILVNHYNAPSRQVQLAVDRFVASFVEMR
ncbi:MAG: D-alanyl-D-alanine carboxypeptidase/D-alanyl-D-alanine-endopeptidase [Armatimonadetes bacterium]|nr:D-alanyl-D-alanine carboxypeptidase/D-alanyl-D-alanine-endopeptidase [Armatimonadota bacterium]